MRGVYFIAGIYGIGKSTVAKEVANMLGISYYEASALIKKQSGEEYGAKKHVRDVNHNQDILAEEVSRILENESSIILTGHFAIFTKERNVESIPISVFEKLGLATIILLETDIESAIKHLEGRDNKQYTYIELDSLAQQEKQLCINVAKQTKTQLFIHQMDYINDADIIQKFILSGEQE